jgi:hypothetical protein
MRKGSSEPRPALPPGAPDGEATRNFLGPDLASRDRPDDPANPSPHAPTEVLPPHAPTEVVRHGPGIPAVPPADRAELTAERVWRSSHPARRSRRLARQSRLFGPALTVILLAASGVHLYLRIHHAPFRVTEVVISQPTRTGCGVDVTGRITTNGAAGTVSYQWLFRPDLQPPQPLSQSVIAGQHAVYVTAAFQGAGHGSALETVALQVLGPELATASKAVAVNCP